MKNSYLLRQGFACFLFFCSTASVVPGNTLSLVPSLPLGPVPASGITVRLEPFVQMPATYSSGLRARLSMLRTDPVDTSVLWVNDQRGPLYRIRDGQVELFANLADSFPHFVDSPGLGSGVQSFALHPAFADNGRFYTVHTESAAGRNPDYIGSEVSTTFAHGVVTEWVADDPLASTFSGDSRELLRIAFPHQFHGIQEVAFNPNADEAHADYGLLYITIGDGGAYNLDQSDDLMRLDGLYGTVLRIDPEGNDSRNEAYGIPADNPFVNHENPEVWTEIYAYGFRNPHRIVFQPADQAEDPDSPYVFINEIGERNFEEVNLLIAGANYGWPWREGTYRFRGESTAFRDYIYELPLDDEDFGYTYPIAQWDRSPENGRAIGSGIFYGGQLIPELKGHYIMANIPEGELYHFPVDRVEAGTQTPVYEFLLETANGFDRIEDRYSHSSRVDIRMGTDHDGEMLVMVKASGQIYRMVAATQRWHSFELLDGNWTDTGDLMGLIETGKAPWIYSQRLGQWFYWPAQSKSSGEWIYVGKP